jgi:hypothetical protein
LGLASIPNSIAVGPAAKPNPTAFGTENIKNNTPQQFFLFKKQQKQRPHGTTVSSTVQTLLYNIKKSHQFTSSLPYEKK